MYSDITQMQSTAIQGLRRSQRGIDHTMERLTTGQRINDSAEVGAELIKLSRLVSQVTSLKASIKNVSESLSLLDTADAALDEIQDILDRMRTIAVESSSDAITATERTVFANETGELLAEIESIASSTSFNKRRLLDGSLTGLTIQAGPSSADTLSLSIASSNPESLGAYSAIGPTRGALAAASTATANTTTTSEDIILSTAGGSTTIQVGDNESAKAVAASVNAVTADTSVSAAAQTFALLFSTSGSSENYTVSINGTSTSSFSISNSSVTDAVSKINLISSTTGVVATTTSSNQVLLHDADGDDITIENTSANVNLDIQAVGYDGATTEGNAVSLAATNNNDATRVIGTLRLTSESSFSITQSGTSSLGYASTGTPALSSLSSVSIETASGASLSIAVIDGAINQVSEIRGRTGSAQSRLGFVENFLTNQALSKEIASGAILDADIALESAKLAKAMVLQEINTALLAQANAGTSLLTKVLLDAA
ncbi:MAG: hypothetical protein CMF52_08415 [Legionellales bacterium]|nr:hypothetical protein [Legionellales bacterium]